MLTVLIRYKNSGREVVLSAKFVEFVPKGGPSERGLFINDGTMSPSRHFGVSDEDSNTWRDVFVMNDKGQTVARYIL